jgi:hypothetical protein
MRMRSMLAAAVAGSALLGAQPVSGPVEGYLFDTPAKRFRAVRGIPGAATLAPPAGPEFEAGWVAPARDWGIGCRESRCSVLTALGAEAPAERELPGEYPEVDGAAWSGDGSVAVLYSSRAGWVRVVSGLPASPGEGIALSTAPLAGRLAAVAALDGGEAVIAMAGEGGGVFRVRSGDFLPLLPLDGPVALEARARDGRLFVLDRAGRVTGVHLATGAIEESFETGLEDPRALLAGTFAGRGVLYAAGGRDQAVRLLDAETGEVRAGRELPVPPGGLEQFGRNSLICGTRRAAGEPLWMLVPGEDLAVFFIPPGEPEAGQP